MIFPFCVSTFFTPYTAETGTVQWCLRRSEPNPRRKERALKNYYEKELLVSSVYTDRNCVMSVYQATMLIQDAMTELFHSYQCDAVRLSKSHNAVWAVARTKIRYDGYPFWMDQVRIRAFPVKITPVAVHLNCLVETLDGKSLIRSRQELCVMDVRDHRLRRVDSTPFPMDLTLLPPVLTDPCRRMKMDLVTEQRVYSHLIRTMDTDMNHHMNNIAFVRLVGDALPSDFWDHHQIYEFDIQYVNEGMEGETLEIYRDLQEDACAVQIKADDRTLVKTYFLLGPAVSPL